VEKEMSKSDSGNKNMENSLRRISSVAELLEKEFKGDLERIKKLAEKGEHEKAAKEMEDLLKRMQKKLSEERAKSAAMSKSIAREVKERVDKISKKAGEILKRQEVNKIVTDKQNIKPALNGQEKINEDLHKLNEDADRLSDEYPFIMYSIKSYAGAAELYGEKSARSLNKSELKKSSQYQHQVIQYLKNLMNSLSQQTKLMEELAEGNFEGMSSGGFANRIVLIPKEAAYTIPVDFKNKVIEMSKDRNKISREKEVFWRNILE
jgi:hypothetical protein